MIKKLSMLILIFTLLHSREPATRLEMDNRISPFICKRILVDYPLIFLPSKSPNGWLRVFRNPLKSEKYGIFIKTRKGQSDSSFLIKCISQYKKEDMSDYTLGSYQGVK